MLRNILVTLVLVYCAGAYATSYDDFRNSPRGEYYEHEMRGYQIQPENTQVKKCDDADRACQKYKSSRVSGERDYNAKQRPDFGDDAALSEHR